MSENDAASPLFRGAVVRSGWKDDPAYAGKDGWPWRARRPRRQDRKPGFETPSTQHRPSREGKGARPSRLRRGGGCEAATRVRAHDPREPVAYGASPAVSTHIHIPIAAVPRCIHFAYVFLPPNALRTEGEHESGQSPARTDYPLPDHGHRASPVEATPPGLARYALQGYTFRRGTTPVRRSNNTKAGAPAQVGSLSAQAPNTHVKIAFEASRPSAKWLASDWNR